MNKLKKKKIKNNKIEKIDKQFEIEKNLSTNNFTKNKIKIVRLKTEMDQEKAKFHLKNKKEIIKEYQNSINKELATNQKKYLFGKSTKVEDPVNFSSELSISIKDFIIHSVIGKGSFGEVYLVEKKDSGIYYAAKCLLKSRIVKDNLQKYVITERNILSEIRHPFIIKLHYAFQNNKYLFLVMDYHPGYDLGMYLQNEVRFSERRARMYISEIILAIEELHKLNIIYRDLKPENLLLDSEGHIVLIDFGLAKENIVKENMGAKSFCGSVAYLAPEMISKLGHGKSIDYYLLGVVLYEMVTGLPPFYSDYKEELFYNIQNNTIEFPEYLSPDLKQLLTDLLNKNPLDRPNIEKIKKYKWFKDISWDEVYRRELKLHKPEIKNIELNKRKNNLDCLLPDYFRLNNWTFIDD